MNKIVLSLIALTISASNRVLADASNMSTALALDLTTDFYTSDASNRAFLVLPRSAELMIFAPIDPYFDGKVTFAGHAGEGDFILGLHEAFVSSSRTLPRYRWKLGKFFLGVGRLNQIHQHDWPFTVAPKAHEKFFADEGAADTGMEHTWILPTETPIELSAGVTSGYCYGHCHGAGKKPPRPLFYVRGQAFFDMSSHGGLLIGGSHLDRRDYLDETTRLTGIDITFKQRDGRRLAWLVQNETFFEQSQLPGASPERNVGGYFLTQHGLDTQWSVGLRLDYLSQTNRVFPLTGEARPNFDYGIVPMVAWKGSEFSNLRLSLSHLVDTQQGDDPTKDTQLTFQFTYILGAHPAHDF